LTGTLEPTNEPYAIAKISGIKMCESYNRQYDTLFRAVMPANLYGPFDNFHLRHSHVIAALIRKFHLAKLARSDDIAGIKHDEETYGAIPADIKDSMALSADSELKKEGYPKVVLWGTGEAYREFLHVDDMADACLFVMGLDPRRYSDGSDSPVPPFLNIGAGKDISIAQVAEMVKEIVGYEGEVVYDRTKPDGTPRKLLDTSRINSLGWHPEISLKQGLEDTYKWYLQQ